MRLFAIFICNVFFIAAFGQVTVQGTIVDSKTQKPVEFANVYITNTQLGATTDTNGKYIIRGIPRGRVEVIVSFIGYQRNIKLFETEEHTNMLLNIEIEPTSVNLSEIKVIAKKSNKRKKFIQRFQTAFLGFTDNARRCSILNPEVLVFEEKGNTLKVTARDFIKIENRSTGYEVAFLLEQFELKDKEVSYSGKPLFKPLIHKNSREEKRWKKRRERTYYGSIRHFMSALLNDQVKEAGYKIELGQIKTNGKFVTSALPKATDIVTAGNSPYEKVLLMPNFLLKVTYKKEKGLPLSIGGINLGKDHETASGDNPMTVAPQQVSYLFGLNDQIAINYNGLVKQPMLLKEYGYWANERVADLLPVEYLPEGIKEILPEKKAPVLNDFELTNLKIPLEEIKRGTPKRDNIPSIDEPLFNTIEASKWLNNDDALLSVTYNNVTKAYPIRILNWHEIVNDKFGTAHIVITYCPLCGSGIAFKSDINGKKYTFGVSGLLYNSDVLFYDRNTNSLWSQIMGQGISGQASGKSLEYVSTTLTTWKTWKKEYPKSLVLSTRTGFKRDYNKIPYGKYPTSKLLYFPVANEDDRFHPKERVLGISINGKHKAYPFTALSKKKNPITDTFEGTTFQISFDKDQQIATINHPNIKAYTLYWFAWYAFHPETEVFE